MFVAVALRQTVKKTTGLAGLAVDPNGRANYLTLLERLHRDLRTLPETAAYRFALEKTVVNRMNIVKSTESIADIESKIGAGQIEELIVQGNKELNLISSLKQYQPWKDLEVAPPKGQWHYPGRK